MKVFLNQECEIMSPECQTIMWRMRECKNVRMLKWENLRMWECKNVRMQECENAKIQECENARIQECKTPRMQEQSTFVVFYIFQAVFMCMHINQWYAHINQTSLYCVSCPACWGVEKWNFYYKH